jgi:hypothetical protein
MPANSEYNQNREQSEAFGRERKGTAKPAFSVAGTPGVP